MRALSTAFLVHGSDTPPGEGVTLVRLADQSETIYNKRDKRPVIPMVAQNLLCKYGSLLKRAGAVRLQRV